MTTTGNESENPQPQKPSYYKTQGEIDWKSVPPEERDALVVLDTADPFVWTDQFRKYPSNLAKSIMWLMYRMSGHFPTDTPDDQPAKYRDKMKLHDDHVSSLSEEDKKILNEYAKHLAVLSMEEKSRIDTQSIPLPAQEIEATRQYASSLSPEQLEQLSHMNRHDMAQMIEEHLDYLAIQDAAHNVNS